MTSSLDLLEWSHLQDRRGVSHTTTDDDRHQRAKQYWPPTLCVGGTVTRCSRGLRHQCRHVANWIKHASPLILTYLLHYLKKTSTNPEVHNVLHCHHSGFEPKSRVTCAENFMTFGHVVFAGNFLTYKPGGVLLMIPWSPSPSQSSFSLVMARVHVHVRRIMRTLLETAESDHLVVTEMY